MLLAAPLASGLLGPLSLLCLEARSADPPPSAAELLLPELVDPRPTANPPMGRLLLNTAVSGLGLSLGAASLYNLNQAGEVQIDLRSGASARQAELDLRTRAATMEGIASIGLLGGATALWLTTDRIDTLEQPVAWRRFVLTGGLATIGAGLGYATIYNLGEARKAKEDAAQEQDPVSSQRLRESEVAPRETAALLEGIASLACLGTSGFLSLRSSKLSFAASPGGISLSTEW